MCKACQGKRYVISARDDGFLAVERCDACQWHGAHDGRTIYDEDAAALARADGLECATTYPCFLMRGGKPMRHDQRALPE